jgi:hypothetical protein
VWGRGIHDVKKTETTGGITTHWSPKGCSAALPGRYAALRDGPEIQPSLCMA